MFPRSSGILLHPTSLAGRFGIGDLGAPAFEFIDLLASSGQRVWQVLPLGPTGYGDSPYQCFSAFAGNPLLISLDVLIEEGLLTAADAAGDASFAHGTVEYETVLAHRQALWPRVLDRFDGGARPALRDGFERFCADQAAWLDDFALFMAVKSAHGHVAWTMWEPDIARRDPDAMARWLVRCAREIRQHKLTQFLFFEQWQRVRAACHARSIALMGDLPIFVAHDSADVWAQRELFRLEEDGRPSVVAGVPPDYFSATGQLWGNPHYRWDVLERSGYAWWVERFRALLEHVDRIRIDHFRGFVAAWEVPRDAPTAVGGRWVTGPGAALFDRVRSALRAERLPFVAENLGVITPEVEALRERFDWPGMAILQFAFGTDPQAPDFKPHNYPRNRVVYTGTHDNDTTAGWWSGDVGHSTRSEADIENEREHARLYLGTDGRDVHWDFIRAVLASVADTAMVPAQDLLGLGSEARMNRPGTLRGNWRWRLRPGQLTEDVVRRLGVMTETYDRI
ncbi:MAG TPA: 4-alpha-glucanotransferase [Vicinamibacterales bacterium]|nr:4-alpha-glucanotransferase [Vicinamibacterales bacterium]